MTVAPTATTGEAIQSVIDMLKIVVEFLLNSITNVVAIVMANPLLLIPVGVIMCYTVIKVFKALF